MKFQKLFMLVIASGIVLQACKHKPAEEGNTKGVSVQTQEVSYVSTSKAYHYSGTVSSLKKSTLSTRIMGQIDKVLVNEGDHVTKGQLLVKLRSNDIVAQQSQVEANILAAKAAFTNAEADFNRITTLYESKSATKKELDDISTQYKMTKAQLTAAENARMQIKETLAYANIQAPYNGIITDKFINAGDMANPGMPLMAIEAPGEFEVTMRIPETEINIITKKDAVEVKLKNSNEVIPGIISHISPSSRLSGAQFEARILLQATDTQKSLIRSGMFANISLNKGMEDKILIANDLIINKGQLSGVWTVSESGTALLRWVQLGKKYNDQTEVLAGLSKGDKLIIQSNERLYDGLHISASNKQ
jgi:RND family efflux transporter MFP subunit